MNTYINIENGTEVDISDKKYAESYIDFDTFRKDVFSDRNINLMNISQPKRGSNYTEFDIEFDGVQVHAIYANLKNSGLAGKEEERARKRVQINKDTKYYFDDVPHYVISSYNTFDKRLYFFIEAKEFIKNAVKGTTYSSLWVDYSDIWLTYDRGQFRQFNDKTKRWTIGATLDKIQDMEDEDFINRFFSDSLQYIKEERVKNRKQRELIQNNKEFIEDDTTVYVDHSKKLVRNESLRKQVFERANYTCELCGTKETFKDKEGLEYFEGHHLIMFNYKNQMKFNFSLDNLDNIICLCPMCHKKIHLADDSTKIECVEKLLDKHPRLRDIYSIKSVKDIIDEYIKGEKDDE